MVNKTTAFVLRSFQIIFGVTVLGLSVHAINWQRIGNAPATTYYTAFAGAFGMLTALIGTVAMFIGAVPDRIVAIVDTLASFLFLAGGIAFAVGLEGISCGSCSDKSSPACWYNYLVSGGCKGKGENQICGAHGTDGNGVRCRMIEADSAFLFLGFLVSVTAAVLYYMASRRSGREVRHAAV
ncbi:hypothetical protein LTR08_004626 [Meristemomyces frigidus]|nr:hypothetical protein LTR08_004626 [Meristemomyces frigidus]